MSFSVLILTGVNPIC